MNGQIVEWLFERGTLATLSGLRLPEVGFSTINVLARVPEAAHLDDLELGLIPFRDHALERLSTSSLAPRRLSISFIDAGGLDAVLSKMSLMRHVTDLTVPDVSDVSIGRQLRRLEVTRLEPTTLELIASAPEFARLEELCLGSPSATQPVDLSPLLGATRLEALKVLRLRHAFSVKAAEEVLRAPLAERLEVLEFRNSKKQQPEASGWDGLVIDGDPNG